MCNDSLLFFPPLAHTRPRFSPPLLFLRSAEPSGSFDQGYAGGFDDGLRRRNVPSFDAPRPRTSDEEDEEEELEFKLAEKKEEKAWLSVNKCIAGALVLLFLGSLFLSGESPELHLPGQPERFYNNYKSATKSLPAPNFCQSSKCHTHFLHPYVSSQTPVLLERVDFFHLFDENIHFWSSEVGRRLLFFSSC